MLFGKLARHLTGAGEEKHAAAYRSMSMYFGIALLLTLLVTVVPRYLMGHSSTLIIDGRSQSAFQESLEHIRAALSEDELKEFEAGLSSVRQGGRSEGEVRRDLDGESAQFVIMKGKRSIRIREERISKMFPHLKGQLDSE